MVYALSLIYCRAYFFFKPCLVRRFGISVIFIKSIPVSFAKKLARQNFLSLLFLIKYTDFVKNKTSLVYKLFDVQGILIIRCRPYPLYYYQKLYSFLSDETFETISYFWVDD